MDKNIIFKKPIKLETFDKLSLIQDYLDKMPIKQILLKYNVSETPLYNFLKEYSIPRDGQSRFKYKVNTQFFDKIDSQEKAYILGLFFCRRLQSSSKTRKCYRFFMFKRRR